MSRTPSINAFKHKNEYVSDGERCENCRHYKSGYTKLMDSIPRTERPYCKLGEFYTNKLGICNEWELLRKAQENERHRTS